MNLYRAAGNDKDFGNLIEISSGSNTPTRYNKYGIYKSIFTNFIGLRLWRRR